MKRRRRKEGHVNKAIFILHKINAVCYSFLYRLLPLPFIVCTWLLVRHCSSIRKCLFNASVRANAMLQHVQTYGFSPVWIRLCLCKSCLRANNRGHVLQSYGLLSACFSSTEWDEIVEVIEHKEVDKDDNGVGLFAYVGDDD